MAFTVEITSDLSPDQVALAIRATAAGWQPSSLPEALRGQGIYGLVGRANARWFTLRLRSQAYPTPLLAELRGSITEGKPGQSVIHATAALPRERIWQHVVLGAVALWASRVSSIAWLLVIIAALRIGQRLTWNAALTPESPSARYLLDELQALLIHAPAYHPDAA
jgi:hypothetical protein